MARIRGRDLRRAAEAVPEEFSGSIRHLLRNYPDVVDRLLAELNQTYHQALVKKRLRRIWTAIGLIWAATAWSVFRQASSPSKSVPAPAHGAVRFTPALRQAA